MDALGEGPGGVCGHSRILYCDKFRAYACFGSQGPRPLPLNVVSGLYMHVRGEPAPMATRNMQQVQPSQESGGALHVSRMH